MGVVVENRLPNLRNEIMISHALALLGLNLNRVPSRNDSLNVLTDKYLNRNSFIGKRCNHHPVAHPSDSVEFRSL